MNKRDLLSELNQETIDQEEAEDVLSRILDSDGVENVKELLSLSDVEWTAKAQGAD